MPKVKGVTKATNNSAPCHWVSTNPGARGAPNLLSGTLLAGTGLGGSNGTAFAVTKPIGSCTWTQGVMVGKTGTPGFNYPTAAKTVAAFIPPMSPVSMVANL